MLKFKCKLSFEAITAAGACFNSKFVKVDGAENIKGMLGQLLCKVSHSRLTKVKKYT